MHSGAPSSSGAYAAAERGAGGKLRRPFARRQPSTPYARPPAQQRRPAALAAAGGGWISKIVNPAYRLIAGGATRLLPSVFSSSSTPAPLPAPPQPQDEEFDGLNQEAENVSPAMVDLSVFKPVEDAGHTNQEGKPDVLNSAEAGHGKPQDLAGDPGLFHVEQIIKGNRFCREEVDRLMKLLQSRVVEDQGEQLSEVITTEKDDKGEIALGNPQLNSGERQGSLNIDKLATSTPLLRPRVQDEIGGASPVELAKAYMGSRMSEIEIGSKSLGPKNDRLLSNTDEFVSNRFLLPPSPKSSLCWPGAIIQEQHGCSTPYSQRSRFGRNNRPRTPYSRAIYSKSKSKLAPSEGDNKKLSDISPTTFPKHTSIYGESRMRVPEDQQGSVGPIRRSRRKFVSETPSRGSPSIRSSQKDRTQTKESVYGDSPLVSKTYDHGPASASIQLSDEKGLSEGDTSVVHPHTSRLARQILEQISRTPTRKEKSDELKLAFAKKNSSSSEVSGTIRDAPTSRVGGFLEDKGRGSPFFKVPPTNIRAGVINGTGNDVASASDTLHKSISPFSSFMSTKTKQNSIEANNTHAQKSQVAATTFSLSGAQAPNTLKGPTTSGTKPVLAPISIDKSSQRVRFGTDNCSSGFTFPTSAASTTFEPPTPSVLPSSSPASPNPSGDGASLPAFTFGEKKSSAALVFSFPSAGDDLAVRDAPVFKFGSEARRVSFGSVPKDALCC